MYFKEAEIEQEYGKLLIDMQKFQRVADNLDLSKRKIIRETNHQEVLRKLQEEEDEARRQQNEAEMERI
jgi:uncharacterized membrane protein (DUF106 family)